MQVHAIRAVEQPALRCEEDLYAAHQDPPSLSSLISLPRRKNAALLNSQGEVLTQFCLLLRGPVCLSAKVDEAGHH